MKFLDDSIEWIVTIAVLLITTFIFDDAVRLFFPKFGQITLLAQLTVLFLMLVYQHEKFGWERIKRSFYVFFIFYSIYVLLYMTVFRVYPLNQLLGVPKNVSAFYIRTAVILSYLLCADTIIHKFSLRKFVLLSVVFCIIPSLWYINTVGVNFFQDALWGDEESCIPPLNISYANVPILVLALLFYDELSESKWLGYLLAIFISLSVGYILIEVTKRGPILWGMVNLAICYYFKSKHVTKYILVVSFIGVLIYVNFETMLDWLYSVAPSTANRIYRSVYEGDTAARFDLQDQGGSNYIIGFRQFLTSPVWGSYFRTVTSVLMFKGVYPHNIFIEMLMTMGLIGFIPFLYFIRKVALNVIHFSRRLDRNRLACISLFLASFLQLQTTGTIVLNSWFWVFFYVALMMNHGAIYTSVDIRKIKKVIKTDKVFRFK